MKTVLVTGGTRGIGKAIALAFLKKGYRVCVTYSKDEQSANTAKEDGLEVFCVDSRDEEAIVSLFKQLNRVDILVNNAGITRDTLLMRMKEADWNAVIQTNLTGVFYVTKAVSKIMMKQRYGKIVNMSSVVGLMGNAGQANYAAAKAGVIGFTKSMAKELAARNITVNAIAPGFIATDMTAVLSDKVKEDLATKIPMGRLGEADDIASAVLFLVSDSASYITGQTLNVDDGMVM